MYIRVGNFCNLKFPTEGAAEDFLRGYKSGMSRIWRTTYVIPKYFHDDYYRRGFRFAWLAHWYGRKYVNDQFPEAFIIDKIKENYHVNN